MPSVRINNVEVKVPAGVTILDAVRQAQVTVPTLCHDDRLAPIGGCRLCLVHVAGSPRPIAACTTTVAEGMEIETHTKDLEDHRRTLLELLASHVSPDTAAASQDKEFSVLLRQYGVDSQSPPPTLGDSATAQAGLTSPIDRWRDESHPYIDVDMSRCVTCFRCVRICDEVQGQGVWQIWDRGDRLRIRPDSGTSLMESSCVSCGACVDTCPSGALEDRLIRQHGVPSKWVKTTCPYCGTGCEMQAGIKDNRLLAVRPVHDAPVNQGHLCVKGRYAFGFVHAPDRITTPMIRSVGGDWQEVTWDEAISHVASEVTRILLRDGANAIGVLGSARATNEENYVAQKFARVVLGTNNVDCCARVCHAPTAEAMKQMLGAGAATNSFDDIEQAHTILVVGSNTTENHPIVGARIRQAARRGANLIVIDPRRIELAEEADCHLAPRPGTNPLVLNAMAATIVQENLIDEGFLTDRVSEFGEFREFVSKYQPERVADACGVPAYEIRRAARLYATAKPAYCLHGLGITEHVQGTEGVMCLINLALLTGNLGRPGAGINPMRGQNNVQGSAQMGCTPEALTGGVTLGPNRDRFEAVWKTPLPHERGLDLLQMMDAATAGTFKALWTIGYDVLMTNADMNSTRVAFRGMECVIVQDLFLTETAREFGTVFLPAASSFEKDGTFMNAERRIQRVRAALPPQGQSRTDWEILSSVAHAMGAHEQFAYRSEEEIWNEIRRVWPAVAGMTYARLDLQGLQWPCPHENHPGTTLLHQETFPSGQRVPLRRIEYAETREVISNDYPFLLTTGRSLYHFNARTMTGRTDNMRLEPQDCLEISPIDASRLGVQDHSSVIIESRYGAARLAARITDGMKPGQLFCTFHDPQIELNLVTGPGRDRWTNAPEYKLTAVRLRPCT